MLWCVVITSCYTSCCYEEEFGFIFQTPLHVVESCHLASYSSWTSPSPSISIHRSMCSRTVSIFAALCWTFSHFPASVLSRASRNRVFQKVQSHQLQRNSSFSQFVGHMPPNVAQCSTCDSFWPWACSGLKFNLLGISCETDLGYYDLLVIQPVHTCSFIPSQIQNSALLFFEFYEISVNTNFLRTVALSLGI